MRSDARELKRKAQKGARQAAAFQIVIIPLAFLPLKINRRQFLAGVIELGS